MSFHDLREAPDLDLAEVGRSIQIAGVMYANTTDAWVLTLPAAVDLSSVRVQHLSFTIEEWTQFLRQTDTVSVEVSVQDANGKLGKAFLHKSNRQISQHISWLVYRRDDFRCRYCGTCDVPLTVDHLITWESGGPSIPENLVASCSKCNNARGEMPYAEWLSCPEYKRRATNLEHSVKFANQALIPTLTDIPMTPLKEGKKRKRR